MVHIMLQVQPNTALLTEIAHAIQESIPHTVHIAITEPIYPVVDFNLSYNTE